MRRRSSTQLSRSVPTFPATRWTEFRQGHGKSVLVMWQCLLLCVERVWAGAGWCVCVLCVEGVFSPYTRPCTSVARSHARLLSQSLLPCPCASSPQAQAVLRGSGFGVSSGR
eukprot:scaffold289999_cov35-Tisochrysis_lutea.AAC.4